MKLLIDIGNTRLKWATVEENEIIVGQAVFNAEIDETRLIELWRHLHSPVCAGIACVGPNRTLEAVTSVLKTRWPNLQIFQAKSEASCLGVTNAYEEPEKLGIDRWLSLIAAHHKYRRALCVVGCGTAITFDRLDASGQHLGGLISPGLRLMRDALVSGTEKLPPVHTRHPFGLANSTAAAIHNGTLAAACGLIETMAKSTCQQSTLIMTGGDADILSAQLSGEIIIEPDLVLTGLALRLQKL